MARLERELFVNAPPERVFALLAQPERAPEWSPSVRWVRRTSDGPIGVGSTTESVVSALGTQQRATGRCVVFEPPRRIVIDTTTNLGARSRSVMELTPEGAGTRLRAILEYKAPGGPVGRLLERAAIGQTRQELEQALERLKAIVEAGDR